MSTMSCSNPQMERVKIHLQKYLVTMVYTMRWYRAQDFDGSRIPVIKRGFEL